LLFAVSGKISDLVKIMSGHHGLGPGVRNAVLGIVAIYGGFFGAGMGIMILAAVALTEAGEFDFHKANATKNVVATLSQTLAVLMFIAGGLVHWPEAGIICVTAIVGGYYGIYLTRRISVGLVRAIVVTAGAALTLVFFLR
jgi:hypothetical protein